MCKFWDGLERTDSRFCRDHPVVQSCPANRRIPFGMHGDDAGVAGKQQVLGISWGSVCQSLSTMDSRICFTAIRTGDCVRHDTIKNLYRVFTWSVNAMSNGFWPYADHDGKLFSKTYEPWRFRMAGKALAEGFRGAWTELRGDWKYLVETLHLQGYYGNADRICHLCNVRKIFGEHRYTDFLAPQASDEHMFRTRSGWHMRGHRHTSLH